MKPFLVFTIALFFATTIASCEETDSLLPDTPPQRDNNSAINGTFPISPEGLTSNLESKTWKISLFVEDYDNETSKFAGYGFYFNSNGTVEAQKGDTTRNGTWGSYTDDGKTEFWMSFPYTDFFYELSDDWYLINNMGETVRFEDSNPREDVLVLIPY